MSWLPIESAPKDGRRVLLVGSGLRPFVGRWDQDDGWLDERDLYRDPIYWADIPEPPTDDRWELTEAGRAMRGGK